MNVYTNIEDGGSSFRMGACRKSALAQTYFPDADTQVAVRRLKRWIDRCQPLMQALADIGYNPHNHILSAREVRLIVQHLGEP